MENLLVNREYCHLPSTKKARVVERPHFQDDGGQTRPPRSQMRAAFGAEFSRDRPLNIASRKLLRFPLRVTESIGWHEKEHVGRAAADILAFTAVALRLQHRLAFSHIAHDAAIAPAIKISWHLLHFYAGYHAVAWITGGGDLALQIQALDEEAV